MTLQILVVEDHGDTRRVLTGLLGHFGHTISAADTVKSALAFLRAKRFDAIVSDLGLPDGSGCEVIREAKRQRDLTGIALTARGMGTLLGGDGTQYQRMREIPWISATLGLSYGSSSWYAALSDFSVSS